MADYTPESLALAAYNAGFRGDALRTAAAVSLAENQARDLHAHNTGTPGNPEDSWGPWQINRNAWASVDPVLFSEANLTTLQGSANAAHYIYEHSGNSFAPWSMFTNGTYQQFTSVVSSIVDTLTSLGGGVTGGLGLPNVPSLNPLDGVNKLVSILTAPLDVLTTALTWLVQSRHWWQVGFVLLGLGMTGLGFAIFFKPEIETVGKAAAIAA